MKVLDLQCAQLHVFEGWFASEDDFLRQLAARQIGCPMCGDAAITKRLSAPHLNFGGANPLPKPSPELALAAAGAESLQAKWLALARHVVANTEDVGSRFVREARRMHHGEVAQRGIRGQASPDDALQLLDEGIDVMPLHLPAAARETLQ